MGMSASPYAAIRRIAKPSRFSHGPTQNVPRGRSNDIRAASSTTSVMRLHREGEIIWVSLNPPIRSSEGSDETSILFWPGIIEGITLGKKAMPKSSQTSDGTSRDADMDGLSASPAPSSSAGVSWTVKQWTVYNVKLLAIPRDCSIPGDQVLPYQAYGPSAELLDSLRSEVSSGRSKQAADAELTPFMDMPSDAEQSQYNQSDIRFAAAAVQFSTAIQIAVSLSDFWTVTDDWEFKYTVPSDIASELPSAQPVHSAISESMLSNQHGSISAPPQRGTGPIRNMPPKKLDALNNRMLGPLNPQLNVTQSFTQSRYQGLWWGAERIWTDELVRLKIARRQIAPDGADHVYPPAGPSRTALEAGHGLSPDLSPRELGAEGRGVFMKLQSLFVIELPQDRGGTKGELRASGMLFELVDVDWDGEGVEVSKGKGKEREHVDNGFLFNGIGQSSSFSAMNLDPALQSASAPTSPLKVGLLPNPDPSVAISDTASDVLAKTLPDLIPAPKPLRSPNSQLSHPGFECPLPAPPTGFKFRAILPQDHEAVVSLSLISGRYYPGLLESPLMQPSVARACSASPDQEHEASSHLWALEGLSPGFHNSVDPVFWKPSRKDMLLVAEVAAHKEIDQVHKNLVGAQEESKAGGSVDVEMLSVEAQ